ncbi:DUF1758 domain-containing protein [Trichonephila clavata]|uniref:DUF1758 domain-containing protein n=1 Tax=Trichonephila clavata TaxID=2740835 RepID=A0A8X6GK26_TRICU|nr:DUF1758 domain-containing protein [Trichonephila clavata]
MEITTLNSLQSALKAKVDLSETDTELEQLEDRLDKTEVRFHFLLFELDNTKNISVSEIISKENNVLSVNESRQTSIKLPEIPLPQLSGLYEEWSTFKDQFDNLISYNKKLTNSQKLYYLRFALKGHAKHIECSDDSFEALLEDLTLRYDFARNHRLCLNCLRNSHYYFACKSKFMCNVGGKKHNTLLHKSNDELRSPDRLPPQDQLNTENKLTIYARRKLVNTTAKCLLFADTVTKFKQYNEGEFHSITEYSCSVRSELLWGYV